MRKPEEIETDFGFIRGMSIFSNTLVIKDKFYELIRQAQKEAWNEAIGSVIKNSDMVMNGNVVYLNADKIQKLLK